MTGNAAERPFTRAVHRVVRRIPAGRVTSYGAVAALAGSPRAARGVGAVLNALTPDRAVPWWRVVNRAGLLTIPAELGLRALQRRLLEEEGVTFLPSGAVDLEHHAWEPGRLDADGLPDPDVRPAGENDPTCAPPPAPGTPVQGGPPCGG